MIRLSETTELTASAAEVHDFPVNMTPARYTAWHPHDHVRFTQVRDARDEHGCGQVVRFRERIGRHTYRFTCRLDRCGTDLVEYGLTFPLSLLHVGRGQFVMAEHSGRTRLTAIVEL